MMKSKRVDDKMPTKAKVGYMGGGGAATQGLKYKG